MDWEGEFTLQGKAATSDRDQDLNPSISQSQAWVLLLIPPDLQEMFSLTY